MTAPAEIAVLAAMRATVQPEVLLQPRNAAWDATTGVQVPLRPTPLDSQPSAYVRESWAAREYGLARSVHVSAAVASGHLLVRVAWNVVDPRDQVSDNDTFADACGVLFPLDGRTAELATMGSPDHRVTAWQWRAGALVPFVVNAHGPGTAARQANNGLRAAAALHEGAWHVVFARALDAPGVRLAGVSEIPFAVAVWTGANQERAGIKSHTPAWHRLELP